MANACTLPSSSIRQAARNRSGPDFALFEVAQENKYSPQFCESFATNQSSESARHSEGIIWNGQGA